MSDDGFNPLTRLQWWIWLGVGLVALTYMLAALVKMLLPLLIVAVVVLGIYKVVFKKRW